ncbi:unnamed protein product [Calicophoron daubneyi]|uniref:DUF3456 domain-containing protein n=1 Tax=Calicophoron daubneyi TaxID=300641 RepID=A0AAV2TUJ6_CALDB
MLCLCSRSSALAVLSSLINLLLPFSLGKKDAEIVIPTKCEVCRILVNEINGRLTETRTSSKIRVGYSQSSDRKINYMKSELRLLEVLQEPPICRKMLEYKLHKERTGINRFDKSTPQTLRSLKDLTFVKSLLTASSFSRKRGVDVKLDVPLELWDQPPAEVTSLFKQCVPMVAEYEEDIEEWFFNHQGSVNLMDYLCRDRVLANFSTDCLTEPATPVTEDSTSHPEEFRKSEL